LTCCARVTSTCWVRIGVLRDGQLTRAGLLIAGQAEAIGRHLPNFGWTHERMKSATAYDNRADGRDENALALPLALAAIEARINADNPISTIEHGLYHFEYRAYPTIALREALLNALTHLDLRLASPVLVKQYPRRLEITNPGGLVGGITSTNILHHPPLARNLQLVQALARLRLVNRSNLGIGRMFEAMLVEGKEPPLIIDEESAVRIVFKRQETARPFREFIAEEGKTGHTLDVDHLLVCATCSRIPRSTRRPPPSCASAVMRKCATSSTRWCRSSTTSNEAAPAAVAGGA
jgi:ATP-dependent DNA helicase RecG